VDAGATDAARAGERDARLRRGRRFDEFIGPWLRRRPPERELRYYGDWPEPGVARYDEAFWGQSGRGGADG
jgi:acetone carboxylase alpha subunit